MYKKIILSLLLIFCLVGCSGNISNSSVSHKNSETDNTYVKSVFIAYYELEIFTKENDEKQFKKTISKTFKELSSKGFNRVTVQVRPCADAFYKSSYFPVSEYCFGYQGSELIYDPLEIMVECAHKYNLSIEAWINPYRVLQRNDFSALSENNIALKWKDSEKLIVTDGAIYFNPAYKEVTDLIVNGVKEIVLNYDIDSICFDDYFYPTKDKNIDKSAYKSYKDSGGKKSLQDFRRDNINNMVKSVYSAIKSIKSNVTFGISPASNIDYDYSTIYADVIKWSRNEGYVDYICPQIYFGFKNENQPFMQTTKLWCDNATCKLYVALPMYKSGQKDEFAGESGKNEFVKEKDIVSRQVTYLSKLEQVSGFYIFSYTSLKDNEETSNLYSAMQNSSQ